RVRVVVLAGRITPACGEGEGGCHDVKSFHDGSPFCPATESFSWWGISGGAGPAIALATAGCVIPGTTLGTLDIEHPLLTNQ
ncbi:hypothetical protein HYV73_02035, partial [Candidatus Uhrbacteria bacterium]|nr:hypothetical protein [Candidatus Uhrbacteria bacterium]